ncbi:MAG: transposase [Alsobacter sp.]
MPPPPLWTPSPTCRPGTSSRCWSTRAPRLPRCRGRPWRNSSATRCGSYATVPRGRNAWRGNWLRRIARPPQANHLGTIPGIGAVTAAVLTAFTGDIGRFEDPGKLAAYFGVLPVEVSSGVDRDGKARASRRYVMSKRGNDLVRRYLWMAALSAVQLNPAVRALYQRVVAKHPEHRAIAIGHAMRKLLRLAFASWKSDEPFDPNCKRPPRGPGACSDSQVPVDQSSESVPTKDQAAGHAPEPEPAEKVVTAACAATVASAREVGEGTSIDFAHLKSQLPMTRVSDHLGLTPRLRGSAAQRRCACPIHRGDGRGRTFSVNLSENVFCCFDSRCGKQGDVIDLWAALRQTGLREAALDLVRTFELEPAPAKGTEERHG